jgi:hypothetical protein
MACHHRSNVRAIRPPVTNEELDDWKRQLDPDACRFFEGVFIAAIALVGLYGLCSLAFHIIKAAS